MTVVELSEIAAELRTALAEHDQLCPEVARLEAEWKKARLAAHANSTTIHGKKRTVAEHETAADQGSFVEWAEWNAAMYGLKACKERLHSLRQLLSSLQTQARVEAELNVPEGGWSGRRSA